GWRRRCPGRYGTHERGEKDGEQAFQRIRTLWPMCSEVEELFGLRRAMVATGTPVRVEMTAKVSPARTVQNRFAGLRTCAAVAATVLRAPAGFEPAFIPARMRTTAIVTASRNAAGAMYRRQSCCRTTSRSTPRSRA